jgi:hypothetical protein
MIDKTAKDGAQEKANRKKADEAVRWVHAKLAEAKLADLNNLGMDDVEDLDTENWREIYDAEKGNFEPLRQKMPRYAHLLNPPLQGKRKPRRTKYEDPKVIERQKKYEDPKVIELAVWAAKLIPKLWKGTKYKIAAHKRVTAAQIAALWLWPRPRVPDKDDSDYHDFNFFVAAIERRVLKPSGKRR